MKLSTLRPVLTPLALAISAAALLACSGSPERQATPDPDAGSDGSAAESSTASVPSADICNFLLAKTCNGIDPTPAQRDACKAAFDVSATRGCKPYIDKGWACLSTKSPATALGCQLGEFVVVDPTRAESGTAMARCAGAVSDPKCYGGDCSGPWASSQTSSFPSVTRLPAA